MRREILVREYMTAPAASISKDARLLDAALMMRRSGFRHLPIVDGEKLVGIITDRDVQRFAPSLLGNVSQEEYNAIFEETPLEKVMTRNPFTVCADSPIQEATAILHDRKLGCVPVVEGEELVGIITVTDMLRLLHHFLSGSGESLDHST
jgi:acetoin utilization protein AcuB